MASALTRTIKARAAVRRLPQVHHGAITPAELARLGLRWQDVVDFSVSVNPYGPSPAVARALEQVDLARYPDPHRDALRQALAQQHQVLPQQLLVGNGSAELLWLVALAFLAAGDVALVLAPTFGEYARAAQLAGAQLIHVRSRAANNFAVDAGLVAQKLAQHQPKLLFACHPNNPTGTLLPLEALQSWAAAHPATLFVVDEAYLPFARAARSAHTLAAPNILVLRSMTKAHALAGLRLGYALGPPTIIEALRQVQPPWSVNALAQVAGVAALQDAAHLQRTLAALAQHKTALVQALRARGWSPVPSATHFFLLPVADAAAQRAALLAQGVVVRDASSFGLPRHIRIATRTPAENDRLLRALGFGPGTQP